MSPPQRKHSRTHCAKHKTANPGASEVELGQHLLRSTIQHRAEINAAAGPKVRQTHSHHPASQLTTNPQTSRSELHMQTQANSQTPSFTSIMSLLLFCWLMSTSPPKYVHSPAPSSPTHSPHPTLPPRAHPQYPRPTPTSSTPPYTPSPNPSPTA